MTTAAQGVRRNLSESEEGSGGQPQHDQPARARRPARRRWQWLAGAAVVLALLAWLLPAIIARSPALNWVLRSLASELNGELAARSASLGWFSAPRLAGVEIRDCQGQPVLDIPEVRLDKSLWALAWDRAKLGRVRLSRPTVHLVLREGSSNVEDVLAAYLDPNRPPQAIEAGLEIVDGQVLITDCRRQSTFEIEGFQATFALPGDGASPLELQVSGKARQPQPGGRFALKMRMQQEAAGKKTSAPGAPGGSPSGHAEPGPPNELLVKAENMPLGMLQAVLDRLAVSLEADGRLWCDLRCQWGGDASPGTLVIEGTANADDLAAWGGWLGSDRLQLKRFEAACQGVWQGDRVEVRQLTVDSDLGSASVTGSFELADASRDLLARLSSQTFDLGARADLARLAAALPHTLRIREGTEITSGQLQVTGSGRRGPQGMSWQGRIEASNLAAVNHGRHLAWRQPVLVTLAAHESPQGLIVDSLRCDSDFLTLSAAGTPDELSAVATFDLSRLADQLGELVDLGGARLAGGGSARLDWKRRGTVAAAAQASNLGQNGEDRGTGSPAATQAGHLGYGSFQADGEIQLRGFQLLLPGRRRWAEESLVVRLSAAGRTDFTLDTRIDSAAVTASAGADRLEVRLVQAVPDLRDGGVWPLDVRSQGELARWLPRIDPWLTLPDWRLAGSYDLACQLTGSRSGTEVRRGRLAVRELRADGTGWHLSEPQAELAASGRWQQDSRRLEVPSATLTSSSVSAQATGVVCTFPADGLPELAGSVAYQGALDRLVAWTTDPARPSSWHLLGRLAGKAELRHTGGTTAARLETTVNDLVATHQSGRQVHEPVVRLAAQGDYDGRSRLIRLEQARFECSTAAVQAVGQIALQDAGTDVQLGGTLDYDVDKLTQLLSPYLGRGVRFTGRGSSPFSYQGPLELAAAQARAGLGWTQGKAYGFGVGPGELSASLSGGVLDIRPGELAVSEGRVRLASQVRLAPEPKEISVQPGRVADQVRINPQMCAHLLQYIAPVLAGVATAEGRFSIELDGCRLPLADPARGELSGRMIVHSVQVGPGPLVQELAVLLGRATPARLMQESVIPFRMVDGRVYHRDLALVFPDLTIRTSGSVGLDQSLEITAEMPIPPKWRGSNELVSAALRDQLIRVPIGGTLTRPRLDQRALERLSQQFLENAARNVLQDGLNRGMERLFGTQPPLR